MGKKQRVGYRERCILYHLGVVLVSLLDSEGGLHLVLGELDHHPTEGGHRLGDLQAGQLPHLSNNKKSMIIRHRVHQTIFTSAADPGCISRIPDPDFHPSRIPDPKTASKERGEKKFVVIPFIVATNFTKL